jgi:hypothetical protein
MTKIKTGAELLSDLFNGVSSLGDEVSAAGGRIVDTVMNHTGKVAKVEGPIDNPRDWLARWGVPIEERTPQQMSDAAAIFRHSSDGDQLIKASVVVPMGADINEGRDRWSVWHEIGHCCDFITHREGNIIFTPHGMFSTQFIELLRLHQEVIITWSPHSDRAYKTSHKELWAETVAAAIMDPQRVPSDLLAAITPALIERNLPVPQLTPPPPVAGDADAALAPAMETMRHFMGRHQYDFVRQLMQGEEGDYFKAKMIELAGIINAMPQTYESDGRGTEAIAHLHYFAGGQANFYITEKSKGSDVQHQAFGLADLFGDGGELGYISLPEIFESRGELDFHWTPKSIAAIRGETD